MVGIRCIEKMFKLSYLKKKNQVNMLDSDISFRKKKLFSFFDGL